MTLGTAISAVLRTAWVVGVAAVMVGAGAYLVAARHHPTYTATVVVGHKPAQVHPAPHGLRRLRLQQLPSALALHSDYVPPPPGIVLSPSGAATVSITTSGGSAAQVQGAIDGYLTRLRNRWSKQFTHAQAKAVAGINARQGARHVSPAEIAQALAAVRAVKPSVLVGGVAVAQTSNPPPPVTAALLGAVCGALLGVLLILGVYAIRGRLWSAGELAPLGLEVVGIDSGDAADIHRLRAELEARGLGSALGSVVVAAADRGAPWTPIAEELAQAFQLTTDTVLIGAQVPEPGTDPGVAGFLANPRETLGVRRLAERLQNIPAGGRPPRDQDLTAFGVRALLAAAARRGQVTVVDGPPLDTPLGSLLASAADLCVVVVHQRSGRADAVASAVAHLRRISARDPVLCFDTAQARPTSTPPVSLPESRAASSVADDVPANANR